MASESETPVEPTSEAPAPGGPGNPEWSSAQVAESASSERILNPQAVKQWQRKTRSTRTRSLPSGA